MVCPLILLREMIGLPRSIVFWKNRIDVAMHENVTELEKRMSERDEEGVGFAPEDDAPIPYMQRIRDYYQALGYGQPYRWAHYAEVPFAPLNKKLAQSRIRLVTTAAPYQPGKGDQGPGAPYNGAAKFYAVYSGDSAVDHDLRISHIGYDRTHTSAADGNAWLPLPALRRLAAPTNPGVARFLFSDFPLGNPAGRPNDPGSQAATLELALRVLEAAPAPRTTVQSPL